MDNNIELEQLKEGVLKSPPIYSWHYLYKHPFKGYMSAGILLVGCFLFYLTMSDDIASSYVFLSMSIIMSLVNYFLFSPDYEYQYTLTKRGLITIQQDKIPEVAYTIMRASAWVGVVICIVATAMVGPMAFVGAGGFALMAFKMTGFQRDITTRATPFHKTALYEYMDFGDRDLIYITCPDGGSEYIIRCFSTDEQKGKIEKTIERHIKISEPSQIEENKE